MKNKMLFSSSKGPIFIKFATAELLSRPTNFFRLCLHLIVHSFPVYYVPLDSLSGFTLHLLGTASSIGSKPVKLCTLIPYHGHFPQIYQTFLDLFSQKTKVFTLKCKWLTQCTNSLFIWSFYNPNNLILSFMESPSRKLQMEFIRNRHSENQHPYTYVIPRCVLPCVWWMIFLPSTNSRVPLLTRLSHRKWADVLS